MKQGTIITLSYKGPNNNRDAKIIIKTLSGVKKSIDWDYNLDISENYKKAGLIFINFMTWSYKDLVFTSTDNGAIITLVF
jgi:hypothetical protein